MVRQILVWPDDQLRFVNGLPSMEDAADIFRDLRDTCTQARGLGLAAPQIGQNYRMAVAVRNVPPNWDGKFPQMPDFIEMVDPTIDELGPMVNLTEGCLSIPQMQFKVSRAVTTKVSWIDSQDYIAGSSIRKEETVRGYLSFEFQHEVDHLNGRLVVDLISPLCRDLARKKMLKLKRNHARFMLNQKVKGVQMQGNVIQYG